MSGLPAATGPYRRRAARGGVLVIGGGLAGDYVARELIKATIVNPLDRTVPPETDVIIGRVLGLASGQRVVQVDTDRGLLAVSYAELVIALEGKMEEPAITGLPIDDRGRLRVDRSFRVFGQPHIWALGDPEPSTSQDPKRQAQRLARNLRDHVFPLPPRRQG
jgi:hypothetical protein